MDKKLANNIIVGLMVIVGFAALLFVLFNIGGGVLNSRMTLYGRFKHVKGLFMGSEVSLSGLRIGNVKVIKITDGENKELVVEMSISSNMRKFIREDSIATVKTQGILGDKYIEISIGSDELPELKNGANIATNEPEDMVTGISKQFNKEGDFTNLVKNLNTTAQNLAALTAQAKKDKNLMHEMFYGKSGEKLGQSLSHFEGIMRKINNGEGSLGALINDPTVYEDIKAMTGGAKRSAILQYFMRQFIQSGAAVEEKKQK